MRLHDYKKTFKELSTEDLPPHMQRMRDALTRPWAMNEFGLPGVGVKALLEKLNLKSDFSGCYVMIEGDSPIYVGISRGVVARLRQHAFGKTHFDASLTFRIAMAKHPDRAIEELSRSEAMQEPLFGLSFRDAQKYLISLKVAAIHIDNPLELYVFEPYCALELNTHQWNSFETH